MMMALGTGGLELQRIERGIRTLNLQTAEVQRAAQLAQRHLPHVASLDAQVQPHTVSVRREA